MTDEPYFPYLVIDAHQDVAWGWMDLRRDPLESVTVTRAREQGGPIPAASGTRTSALPEWLAGRVGVVVGSLFSMPKHRILGTLDRQVYANAEQAHSLAARQMDFYRALADRAAQIRLVKDRPGLEEVLASWATPDGERLVGLLVSMEGADPIREPAELEQWYEWGLRGVGVAWAATRYAGGTREPGPLTADGFRLLERMAALQMVLDLSHCAEEAYWQALEAYEGPVIASHSNPRRFLPTDRGLSDEMIALLAERDGVVGIVPFNPFLKPGWRRGDPREEVPITLVADAIDHVAQLTGSSEYVALGSDFDGGFGLESLPLGMDTVADLLKVAGLLSERGYAPADVDRITHGNWLRVWRRALPG